MEPTKNLPTKLTFVAGIVTSEEVPRLKRLVFRASKGRSLITVTDVVPDEEQPQALEGRPNKSVYIITFFEKDFLNKVTKICDSFTSERFEIPETTEGIDKKIVEVE